MIAHVFPPEMMLEREKQLTLALLDCAGVCYDINFTQDKILGNPIQIIDGKVYSILDQIGKEQGCSYTGIIDYWANVMPPEEVEAFVAFSDIRQIQARYEAGARVVAHKFWTYDVLGNPMLAEQKIRLYKDHSSGDLLGLVYVSNSDKYAALERKEALLSQQFATAASRIEYMEALSAKAPGGYHRVGIEEGFPLEFTSDSFLEIVGWTREELKSELDNKFINVVAPEDRERFMSMEPALVQDGRVAAVYRILRKDGSRRWVQDATVHVTMGDHDCYQCTLADITDFVHQTEEMAQKNLELAQQKNLLETMEQNMPSGYHRCKAEPGIPLTYVGSHFTEILGFTAEEIARDFDNLFLNLVWPEDVHIISDFEEMINNQGQGNTYITCVYRMKRKGGGYRWVTDSTMFVDLGEDSFFQGIISDITEYMERINEAKEQAEASNLAKSTFLFNASHDIRTPMNAIQGFAHYIEDHADDPVIVRDTIRKLRQSGEILLTLMNDILELSRIERGKETIENRPLDMLVHAQKLKEMMTDEMAASQIQFQMENQIIHPLVFADDLKLTRVAMNLLSNAQKFTPPGGTVTFGIRETDYDGSSAVYSLFVRDTGIGMSSEFQAKAFEQFERERSSTDSGISGSGLGLSIIKRIIDLLGGSCTIESELGKGSCITCAVPCQIARESDFQPEVTLSDVDYSGMRILLVEDNAFNREVGRYIFEELGLEIEEAENGVICLEKITQNQPGYYDFILMDIQMPIMDGYTATREIRQMQDPVLSQIPIIAMTANAFEEDKQQCLAVGMNGHIGKPLDAKAVLNEFARVLRK